MYVLRMNVGLVKTGVSQQHYNTIIHTQRCGVVIRTQFTDSISERKDVRRRRRRPLLLLLFLQDENNNRFTFDLHATLHRNYTDCADNHNAMFYLNQPLGRPILQPHFPHYALFMHCTRSTQYHITRRTRRNGYVVVLFFRSRETSGIFFEHATSVIRVRRPYSLSEHKRADVKIEKDTEKVSTCVRLPRNILYNIMFSYVLCFAKTINDVLNTQIYSFRHYLVSTPFQQNV